MITILTIPKSFKNSHINIIQRNAILSWKTTQPGCEIILFGNEEGVAEAAKEFNAIHIPNVKTNEFGTPLLDSAFKIAQEISKNKFIAYLNSDIVLLTDIALTLAIINKDKFLMAGQRYDFDLNNFIDFSKPEWKEELYKKAVKNKKPRGFTAIDYFIFPKGMITNFPPFAVGRAGWDNWIIFNTRSKKIPVIDSTELVVAVHQNHDYSHSKFSAYTKLGSRVEGPELKKNLELVGDTTNVLTLRDADFVLTESGLRRPESFRFILSKLSLFYVWRLALVFKRKIREWLLLKHI